MANIHVDQQSEFEEQLAIAYNNRHMTMWSLRERCLKAVVDRKELFINDSANLIENLPVTVKNDLIEMTSDLLDDYDEFGDYEYTMPDVKFLGRLLNLGLTTFHVPVPIEFALKNLIEMLMDEVGSKCRKLRHLSATLELQEGNERQWFESVLYRALPQLPSLQILVLDNFSCNDSNLQQFATYSKTLVVLDVACLCDDVSSVGFQALSKLPFLRKFTFLNDCSNWTTEQEKSLVLCSQFLPQLMIVGLKIPQKFIFGNSYSRAENFGVHNAVIRQPMQLSLEELLLGGKARPHPKCQLPNLQRLHWTIPRGEVLGFLARYQTITELALCSADEKLVELVLSKVGQRLNKLVLQYVSLSLSEVCMSCPHLEYVRFYNCQFKNVLQSSRCQNLFPCLKEAFVKMACDQRQMPRNFFKQLLSAPLLKKVRFDDAYLSVSDMNDLLELVRKKRILQNVDYLEWSFSTNKELQSWMFGEDDFKRLLETIIVTFPLIHIVIGD